MKVMINETEYKGKLTLFKTDKTYTYEDVDYPVYVDTEYTINNSDSGNSSDTPSATDNGVI